MEPIKYVPVYSWHHRIFRAAVGGVGCAARAMSKDFYFKAVNCFLDALPLTYSVELASWHPPIKLHCNSEAALIRARTMLKREPETLRWIEGFDGEDVMLDIGSNVGVFSLYAAHISGVEVVAIDPQPYNHAAIVKNITLNRLHKRIMAFCIALSDKTGAEVMHVPAEANMTGGAGALVGENFNEWGDAVHAEFGMPILAYSLDDFLDTFNVPFPNHIKMDVDATQAEVIRGARKTLRDERLRSAMLELNPNASTSEVLAGMEAAGFALTATVSPHGGGPADITEVVTNNFFERRG